MQLFQGKDISIPQSLQEELETLAAKLECSCP